MEEVLHSFVFCTAVPQTGWKYHFILHTWGEVFEETTCVVTTSQLETSEFCFVIFVSYFSDFLYLFSGNDTLVSERENTLTA